ncbi:MAG TPA: polysaccharide biosynthesis tyrosine autokinase [Blastocatellia bacterium]|nr:polysaccharide biosynthesis tyrosine autokinase [Blastocatellia bacterium]
MIGEKPLSERMIPAEEAMILAEQSRSQLELIASRSYPGESSGIDMLQIGEIWRRIRKHLVLIFIIVFIITAIVTVEAYRTKSIYRASATLQLDLGNRTLLRAGDISIESQDAATSELAYSVMKTKIRLLQNRPMLEDVVASLRLDQNPTFMDVTQRKSIWDSIQTIIGRLKSPSTPAPTSLYIEPPPIPAPESLMTRPPQESARLSPYVSILSGSLSASQVEETQLMTISFEHTNPMLAAQVVNTTAEFFIAHNYRNKTRRYHSTSTWLNARTRDLKTKLEQAEQQLATFSGSHGLFSPNGDESLVIEKLSKLHGQVLQAETERILKQSLYEEVTQGRLAQLPEAFADAKLATVQNKLSELTIQASQYAGRFGPDNPRTQDIQKQMTALQKQLDEGRTTLADKLKADYERATRDEQSLRAALEKAKTEAIQQNQATVQFGLLKQEAETAKAMYTEFLQKTNQAAIQLNEQNKDLQVIEAASLPVIPVAPNRMRMILVGFLLSLCFGIGLALVIEYADDTIKSADDVTRTTGLPALAVIPAARVNRLRMRGAASKSTALIKENPEAGLSRPLISQPGELLDSSASMLTEAYRGLRTSLLLSAAGTPPKTLLFTSSEPGEGKTTTTINTAISLAQMGLSVVIIDADLRRPSIHKVFGLDPSHGITSYLSRHIGLASLLQDAPIPCISVLPCGAIPPNPTELISSEKMRTMVQLLREHFDHVLIDSPPLTNVADSLVLSTLADGVVLVVQSNKTKRRALQRMRRELMQVGAKVFGVVLNKADQRNGYDGYYYYTSSYKQ